MYVFFSFKIKAKINVKITIAGREKEMETDQNDQELQTRESVLTKTGFTPECISKTKIGFAWKLQETASFWDSEESAILPIRLSK